MHISELRIRNFRNFLKGKFSLKKGVNTLIGENASGKTNALYALRLLLDEGLSRNAINLRETDFCRALGEWYGQWIVIAIDFEELDPSEGCQLLKHESGHMNGSDRGTYTYFYRPKVEIRTKLHEMNNNSVSADEIRQYLKTIKIEDYETIYTGRSQANYLDDELYKNSIGDFENCRFPNPADEDQAELGVRMYPIYSEITCTFAQALRDVISDLRGYRYNPLLALLRGSESRIQIEDVQRITNAVAQLNKDISSLSEIKGIATGIQNTLYSTVGHTFSPSVSIESALPDHIDKLLQRLSITVGDSTDSDYKGELTEQSLGGANLIYLALKLLEYELKLSSDRVAHFLLIEEPEAHIHTHIQKTLFANQAARKTQVIVSTHSTHISSAAKIRSVNVLARRENYAEVYQPSRGIGEKTTERVERYLDAVRSTLLFAKGIILVEGEAELVMIPAMVRSILGISLDELGISVISMNSAFFKHIAIIFHEDRIRRRCAIVTDLDKSLIALPENPEQDGLEEKHARSSQDAGERRKELLSNFTENNLWIEAFFAEHTFEVEFLAANNVTEAQETVDSIYTRRADKERVKRFLESNNPIEAGQEILRIANKVGKGWFSLLLSETLNTATHIPEYVLRAIAYAGLDGITKEALKRIGLIRTTNMHFDSELPDSFPPIEELEVMLPHDFLNWYTTSVADDVLTDLVTYIDEYYPDDPSQF